MRGLLYPRLISNSQTLISRDRERGIERERVRSRIYLCDLDWCWRYACDRENIEREGDSTARKRATTAMPRVRPRLHLMLAVVGPAQSREAKRKARERERKKEKGCEDIHCPKSKPHQRLKREYKNPLG